MKKLIFLVLLIGFALTSKAQRYPDTITSTTDYRYACLIKKVDNDYIHFKVIGTPIGVWRKFKQSEVKKYVWNSRNKEAYDKHFLSSGNYLMKASNSMFAGIAISLVGNTIGMTIMKKEFDIARGVIIGSGIVGFVFEIVGLVYLRRAGIRSIQQNKELHLTTSNNSIGITYQF